MAKFFVWVEKHQHSVRTLTTLWDADEDGQGSWEGAEGAPAGGEAGEAMRSARESPEGAPSASAEGGGSVLSAVTMGIAEDLAAAITADPEASDARDGAEGSDARDVKADEAETVHRATAAVASSTS